MPRGPLATLAKALSFIQDARAEGLNIVVAVVLPPLWIRHTLRACLTNLVQRTEAIGPMLLMHRRRLPMDRISRAEAELLDNPRELVGCVTNE